MNEMNLMQQPSKIIRRPQPKRRYFDAGIRTGSLSGADTGEAYCLRDLCLAPGIGVSCHPHREGGRDVLHAFRRTAIRRAKSRIAKNREFALRRKFMHHLLLILALPALRASAAERWEVLPPTPAPIHSERSGQANANGISIHYAV
jgi:hypothetical protein